MRSTLDAIVIAVVASGACALACSEDPGKVATASVAAMASPPSEEPVADINPRLLRRFQPLPDSASDPPSKAEVDLGRMLFYDARLSRDGDLSCNSCHALDQYGVDGRRTSIGSKGQLGTRNAPTVYNAAGSFVQFWDGRSPDLEDQAKAPIVNPIEMAMPDGARVVAALKSVRGYLDPFRQAFPRDSDPITFDNVGRAIGAFERGLSTPGRWDRFLRGEKDALSGQEKEGLRTFLNVGCMVCHTGAYVGGSMYERVGVVEPWPNQSDKGRGDLTKLPGDAMMFKVPTLRNVDRTGPYFHDGSVATLPDAVRMMARHQLGLELGDQETTAIVTWLGSLSGELPSAYIARPELPRP